MQTPDYIAKRRLLDVEEVRGHIAEMKKAGAARSAQIAMAKAALGYARLTDGARAEYENLLSDLEA